MDLTLAQPSLFSYPNAFHGFGGSPGFWRSNRSRLSFSISFLIFLHSVILWSCGTLLVDLRIFTTIVFNSEQCEQPFLHLSFFFTSTAIFLSALLLFLVCSLIFLMFLKVQLYEPCTFADFFPVPLHVLDRLGGTSWRPFLLGTGPWFL